MIGNMGWCGWCFKLRQIVGRSLTDRWVCKRCSKSADWKGLPLREVKPGERWRYFRLGDGL